MTTRTSAGATALFAALVLGTLLAIANITYNTTYAAGGDLDPTFSGDGKQTTNYISRHDEARAVAIQSDGKIVVVGTTFISDPRNWDFFVTRYTPNGELDTSFDFDGMLNTDFAYQDDDGAYGVAIQPDGKIVVAGAAHLAPSSPGYCMALARYNTDGSLDTGFGNMLGPNGLSEACFGSNNAGLNQISVAQSVAIQPDGKIVVAGYLTEDGETAFAVGRFNSNGQLDNTFDGNGKLITDFEGGADEARAVAIDYEGKIVVAGSTQHNGSDYNFAVARYNTNGTLDHSLDSDGRRTISFGTGDDGAYGLALESNGGMILAGGASVGNPGNYNFALARLNHLGTLDLHFNGTGLFTSDLSGNNTSDSALSVALQADGKIVAAGVVGGYVIAENFALLRLNTNGAPDSTFSGDGRLATDFFGWQDRALGVAIQPDGKIIAAGFAFVGPSNNFDFAVARYQAADPPNPTPTPTRTSTPPPTPTRRATIPPVPPTRVPTPTATPRPK